MIIISAGPGFVELGGSLLGFGLIHAAKPIRNSQAGGHGGSILECRSPQAPFHVTRGHARAQWHATWPGNGGSESDLRRVLAAAALAAPSESSVLVGPQPSLTCQPCQCPRAGRGCSIIAPEMIISVPKQAFCAGCEYTARNLKIQN
jgi:hypothetical protein